MKKSLAIALGNLALCLGALPANAAIISNVVETGGDNEATDTITAKWTGQTFNVSVAGEPVLGAVVGTAFLVPTFGTGVGGATPAMVDRAHRYLSSPGSADAVGSPVLPVPSYLVGLEYIMSGNDNRDNAAYRLDVTVTSPARAYMLIDNRLLDTAGANPPSFDATHMQWIVSEAWLPTANGLNRTASTAVPDEVGIDEGADNTINNWYSVYYKDFAAGTFSLLQPENAGQNMYGVVVGPVPEPGTFALLGLGLAGIFRRRRS